MASITTFGKVGLLTPDRRSKEEVHLPMKETTHVDKFITRGITTYHRYRVLT